jgi:hypothetical protein
MPVPLLMEPGDLTQTERVSLSALKHQPGYPVLEKLFMAACKRATEEVISLNPTDEGYERKLKALQSRARERNEFSLLILQTIELQERLLTVQQEEKELKPEPNRIVKGLNNDNTKRNA